MTNCVFCVGDTAEKTAAHMNIEMTTTDEASEHVGAALDISVEDAPLCLAHADQLHEGLVDYLN